MARKYKGSKGSGNGYHDSAAYKTTKMNAFNDRVQRAMDADIDRALANDNILEVEDDISDFILSHMCIFCHDIELVKIKENYYKCPKCTFVKKKRGVEL